MYRKWGTLVLFLLATPILALAQNTGKLSGVVTDASTGEPLPGANVIIVGTQLGTAADVDGSYFVLGVPVGTYDVQATFVGYQPVTVEDVEINADYTRELNFALAPGAELDEIVVEYERPLIQKDALGVPKITTAEQIANLPVRGVASVAALQAGVVKEEGSGNLYIRGGREEEVTYYVDGVKVIGGSSIAVPDQAVQEQEMLVGAIPAKYGDAMSGIISVTTKSGAPNLFGSIEAITSEVLDSYGYNDVQATIGGPIVGDKVQFFLSGEYGNFDDANPRAIDFPTLDSETRALIQNSPQSVRIVNNAGESRYVPFPSNIAPGTAAEDVLAQLGDLPEGFRLASEFPSPIYTANTLTSDRFTFQDERPGDKQENIILNGNLQFSPMQSIRLRAGGGFERGRGKEFSFTRSLYAPEAFRNNDRDTWRVFGSWTQYLSNNTFFQLQANYSDYQQTLYNPAFSDDVRDLLFYGDIDHEANAAVRRYFEFNPADSTYVLAQQDGEELGTLDIQNNWSPFGVLPFGGFTKRHHNSLGFRANATTQIGIHQIEFGGEFEKQTQRLFNMNSRTLPANLAKFHNDGNVEAGSGAGVDSYEELPFSVMDDALFYYGYNYLGTEEVNDQSVANFTNPDYTGEDRRNVAPYEPIYYAGYIQDKIEYRDLVLNLGVRVDVFDNNALTLRDPFALFPIVRAGEQGGAPSNIGEDYAVYFNTSGNVVGYRDLEGNFFDTEGQNANPSTIQRAGNPQTKSNRVTEEVFVDYDPQVTFQPRIGLSFPVTDQALFFASYNVISQRPAENQFDTIQQWNQAAQQSKRMNNAGLRPEKTTAYELGFRQRVGARAALQISGFYKQIENLISLRIVQNAFPGNYQTYENVDFGTVKGAEVEFDLRRTNNVSLNANYTLSFAQGTGSDAATTAQIVWRMEEAPFYPRFISPLDFDQRHRANISLDYRLGENEGPQLFGGYPLSNFGFNVVGTFGSGLPYTKRRDETPIYTSFNGFLLGEINSQTMPSSSLVNLRLDRRFSLGGSNLVVYLWVQNLFNQNNVTDVYPQTGLADDDAYLTTPQGRDAVESLEENAGAQVAQSFADHYRMKLRSPLNYGIPRTTRLGVRLDF